MKKNLLVVLVAILIFLGVSSNEAIAAPFQWTEIGLAPYNPNGEEDLDLAAVEEFVRVGYLTTAEGTELKDRIKEKRFSVGELKRGRICRAMMMKNRKIVRSVETAWKHFPAADARLYKLDSGIEYYVVGRCGNPTICEPQSVSEPAPVPKPAVVLVAAAPANYHTIAIRVWSGGETDLLGVSSGRQSRNLGAKLRADAREGKLKFYPGQFLFKVELRELNFDAAKGKTVYINGKPFSLPETFGPVENTILVPMENGEGNLSIPVDIVTRDTALVVHSPWFKPDLKYPPSGSLKTCGPSTAGICGGTIKEGESSEFYRLATTSGESNYHFIK